MSALILPSTRLSQPIGFVQVDTDKFNPAFLWTPSISLTSPSIGNELTPTNCVLGVNTDGIVASTTSGYLLRPSYAPVVTSTGNGLGDFTVIVKANPVASGLSWFGLLSQRSNTSPYNLFTIKANSANNVTSSGGIELSTYSNGWSSVSAAGKVDGKLHVFAGVRKGTNLYLYVDGILVASRSDILRNIVSADSGFAIGVAPPNIGPSTCQFSFVYCENRALSDTEIIQLSDNPWQIFAKQKTAIYFDTATTSGNTTHNVDVNLLATLLNNNLNNGSFNTASSFIQNMALSEASSLNQTSALNLVVNNNITNTSGLLVSDDTLFNITNSVSSDNNNTLHNSISQGFVNTINYSNNGILTDNNSLGLIGNISDIGNINSSNNSSLGLIGNISDIGNINSSNNVLLNNNTIFSTDGAISALGEINVSCTLTSLEGLSTTASLFSNNSTTFSGILGNILTNNINTAPNLSLAVSNIISNTGGFEINANTTYSLLNTVSSSKVLSISGNILLNTTQSIKKDVVAILDNNVNLAALLLKDVLTNIILESGIILTTPLSIIYLGTNPLIKVRLNTKEFLIQLDTRDLIIQADTRDLLVSKRL